MTCATLHFLAFEDRVARVWYYLALRRAKDPKRKPVLREERHEKVGGSMLDRALAQPREWACEWKASKGRRALWAERCRYMDGMTVGAVAAGLRGHWLRQGVRIGCIVV